MEDNNGPDGFSDSRDKAEEIAAEAARADAESSAGPGTASADDVGTGMSEREEWVEEAIIRGEVAGVARRRRARGVFQLFRPKPLTEEQRKRFPLHPGFLVDQYVFVEAFTWWLMGFFGFVSFLVINQLFLEGENLLNPKIPAAAVLKLIVYNIPFQITLAIPVAVVFGTLLSMGRLAKDNELSAFFTNGISLYRLIIPFFILASANSVGMYFVNEKLVAPGFQLQEKIKEMYPSLREPEEMQKKEPTIVRLPNGRYFSARTMDKVSGQVYDVMLDGLGVSAGADSNNVWIAKTGKIQGSVLTLNQPRKYILGADDQLSAMQTPPMAQIDLGIDLKNIVSSIRTPEQLSREELARQQRVKKELGTNTDRDQTDLWLKYSVPFAPIAFALVAMPLSLRAPRDERFIGIIFTLLLIMVYYVLYFMFKTMGYSGTVEPWLAAWMQNIVFAVLSLLILVTTRK